MARSLALAVRVCTGFLFESIKYVNVKLNKYINM